MSFANATSDIHGDFYYFNPGDNSNNCKIKGLQAIIQIAIFISVFNPKCVIYRHIVPFKQNKLFLFHYIYTKRDELFGTLCPPITRCK